MTAASAPGERPAASTGWGTAARQGGYGAAAVVGLVGTGWFNLSYAGADQAQGYLQAWFANAASSSAALDLIVVSLAISVFMLAEGRRLGMRVPWLYVVAGFVLAMAFAVPLFLLMRERALMRAPGSTLRRRSVGSEPALGRRSAM